MHELALVEAALAQALVTARHAGATHVNQLTFRVAADGHVSLDTLEAMVEVLARGTPAEGAAIEVVTGTAGEPELALVSIDVEVDPGMCRLTPARVVRIEGDTAWLDTEGHQAVASLSAVDGVQVGDFVACHAGMVLERLAPEDAEALRAILAEIELVS